MDKEYCEGCSSFYVYLATLAPPDKQFTPTCTLTLKSDGKFIPISEIEKCTMKNTEKKETYYLPNGYADSRPSEPKREGWKFACIPCGGKGYEEKLSCGCTGYRMIRNCSPCNGKGVVSVKIHKIQAEEQRKFWEEKYKVI